MFIAVVTLQSYNNKNHSVFIIIKNGSVVLFYKIIFLANYDIIISIVQVINTTGLVPDFL